MSICIECPMCHHIYGKFRRQCSACGNPTPNFDAFNSPQDALSRALRDPRSSRKKREPKERQLAATACVFCRQRGAKKTCPTCAGRIHPGCLLLHKDSCETQLRSGIMTEVARLQDGERPAPSASEQGDVAAR